MIGYALVSSLWLPIVWEAHIPSKPDYWERFARRLRKSKWRGEANERADQYGWLGLIVANRALVDPIRLSWGLARGHMSPDWVYIYADSDSNITANDNDDHRWLDEQLWRSYFKDSVGQRWGSVQYNAINGRKVGLLYQSMSVQLAWCKGLITKVRMDIRIKVESILRLEGREIEEKNELWVRRKFLASKMSKTRAKLRTSSKMI